MSLPPPTASAPSPPRPALRPNVGGVRPAIPSLRRRRALLAAVAFCLLWPFPYQPQVNNPNENVRLYMTAAIVEDGTYAIDGPWQRWGWVNDAALKDGHHYSVKAPLTSLLGVPGYAAYRALCAASGHGFDRTGALWVVRLTASILPFLAFLWALLPWLGRRTQSPVLRDATWLSVALGSLLYGYALLFVSHTLAAVCAFGALMLLSSQAGAPAVDRRRLFFAGILAAGVTAAEYPGIVVSILLTGLAAYSVRPWQRLLPFVAGAAIPTLAVMHFQWRAFGSPIRPGHLYLENASFRAIHHQGVFGADAFHADAAYGLLFDPGYGLFPLTPIWLPALLGLVWLLRRRPAGTAIARTAALVVLLTWLETAMLSNWRGGWTIGPRYLATIAPFVAFAALDAMERGFARLPRFTEAFAIGGLATALLASGLPSALYPHLPEAIVRPLPQLFWPMLAQGYATPNAGSHLDLDGVAGLVPLALVALGLLIAVIGVASWPQLPMPTGRKLRMAGPLWSRRGLGGAMIAAFLLAPLLDGQPGEAAAADARRWVLGHFLPRPQPADATSEAQKRRPSRPPTPSRSATPASPPPTAPTLPTTPTRQRPMPTAATPSSESP